MKIRINHQNLLAYLFFSEAVPAPPASTVVAQTVWKVRKDYSYLKPVTIVADCTKRELNKFSEDATI